MQVSRKTSPRVLLIDDSEIARKAVGSILEDGGWSYDDVDTPLGATSLIARLGVGILVVDMNMPVMSGSRFAQLVRNNPRFSDIKIVLISGDCEEQLEREGHLINADAVLSKADLVDELLPTLRRICHEEKTDALVNRKAMIVDYDPEEREACRQELEAFGYEVICHNHGRGALAEVVSAKPALVVVAADLPDLPGTAIVELIRENRSTEGMNIVLRAEGACLDEAVRECGASMGIACGLSGPLLSERLGDAIHAGAH